MKLSAGLSAELEEFAVVVRAFCERDRCSSDTADVSRELELKRTLINLLELDFARDAARFARDYDPEVFGNPSPVSWMRDSCHMTSHAAASSVCVGDQAARLRVSQEALAGGRLGMSHLGLMAATLEALDESGAADRFNETRLVNRAESMTVKRFRDLCSHIRHEADREAFLAKQIEDRRWRTLEIKECGEEGVAVTGFLDREGGAVLRSALEPLAERRGRDDARCREQRYADALVELCGHALDTGAVPQRASQRTHLQVTTSLETLLDLTGCPGGEVEFAGVVAGATVQRVACDATITRVLVDPASQVIDVGRSERVVPGATRRALNVRDQGCRWPGCDRTASWTAAHHVVHWTRGGRTDLENLVLLCRRHHWSVHEGGWQLVRTVDGAIATVSPLAVANAPLRSVRSAPLTESWPPPQRAHEPAAAVAV